MYTAVGYVTIGTLLQLPLMCVLSACSLVPAAYGIGGWPWESFGTVYVIFAVKVAGVQK